MGNESQSNLGRIAPEIVMQAAVDGVRPGDHPITLLDVRAQERARVTPVLFLIPVVAG
jgi:hypothetical protein